MAAQRGKWQRDPVKERHWRRMVRQAVAIKRQAMPAAHARPPRIPSYPVFFSRMSLDVPPHPR